MLARCDAALLAPGPQRSPASVFVDGLAGEPLLVRFEGDWPAAVDTDALASMPALTLALGAPEPASTSFDIATPELATAEAWEA
ncbi:MAG: hypothetical protein C4344_00730, partial [Acidimicrobiia bacterium]